MDIHSARQKLKTGTIYDLPLRVTFTPVYPASRMSS